MQRMMKEEVEWRIPLLLWRSHILAVPPQRDLVKHGHFDLSCPAPLPFLRSVSALFFSAL